MNVARTRIKTRFKRVVIGVIAVTAVGYLACAGFLSATQGGRGSVTISTDPAVRNHRTGSPPELLDDVVTLASVNLAHGRGPRFHQLLVSSVTLTAQVEEIGRVLAAHSVDLACLQEADAPSWWSGDFDHVRALSLRAGLASFAHGRHVDGFGLHYGTAVASRTPIVEASQYRFDASPPTTNKGFTRARVLWPDGSDRLIEVISLHLDFARASVRARQIAALVEQVATPADGPRLPIIIAGDFNDDWRIAGAPRQLRDALELATWDPQADMVTFAGDARRIDWVFASHEFEIVDQRVLDDELSDHGVVLTRLRLTRPR